MNFFVELTVGRFRKKELREFLNNEKNKLEFHFTGCSVLVTETKTFWESHFRFDCKNIPDKMKDNVKKFIDDLKELEYE